MDPVNLRQPRRAAGRARGGRDRPGCSATSGPAGRTAWGQGAKAGPMLPLPLSSFCQQLAEVLVLILTFVTLSSSYENKENEGTQRGEPPSPSANQEQSLHV